jgi:hypothetical protein
MHFIHIFIPALALFSRCSNAIEFRTGLRDDLSSYVLLPALENPLPTVFANSSVDFRYVTC